MEFQNQFDLLLEGLAYFGRRAAGKDWQYMEQRVMRQKIPRPLCWCRYWTSSKR